jgi:hypothetical protein
MDTVIKTVNFVGESALTHCKFVALLGEVENEYGKIVTLL